LKPADLKLVVDPLAVAPRSGAWIETPRPPALWSAR